MNRLIQYIGVCCVVVLLVVGVLGFGGVFGIVWVVMDKFDIIFVIKVVVVGMFEVQVSQVVIICVSNLDVCVFVQCMVKDYIMVGDEFKVLVGKKGIMVLDSLFVDECVKVDKFSVFEGVKFDKVYVDEVGVKVYKDVVFLFDKVLKDVKDFDIKVFFLYNLFVLCEYL